MVKQFDQWCAITHGHHMTETDKGQFVLASDYDALAARLAHAEACLAEKHLRLAEADAHLASLQNRYEQVTAENVALSERMAEAEARRDQIREAILWALGERDEFPTREPGQGAYWWRTELRRRAFLTPDSADDDASHEPTCRQLREPLGYCNCNAGSADDVRDPFGNLLPKGRTAFQRYAATLPDSAPAAHFWIPRRIEGRWPYWQCATPNGPYSFQAISLDEAEAMCARERAAHEASVEGEK